MARTRSTDTSFPQQPFNNIIEEDPQIVRVPLNNVDWGTRPSILKAVEKRNKMVIEHVPSKGKKG